MTFKLSKLLISAVTAILPLSANAQNANAPVSPPVITVPSGAAAVEQRNQGAQSSAVLAESFDGLDAAVLVWKFHVDGRILQIPGSPARKR